MLSIKLRRIGKKHQAAYRMIVIPKEAKLNGKFVEDVGFYNPRSKESKLDKERINYWMSVGARPSDTVHNLLVSNKITEKKKIPVHKVKAKAVVEEKKEEKK